METINGACVPTVRITVKRGHIVATAFYAPGLPDGTHDLYPDGVAQELEAARRDAARYRWIRTHQYLGAISHEDPCDAASPAAIQFDGMIDRLMEAT